MSDTKPGGSVSNPVVKGGIVTTGSTTQGGSASKFMDTTKTGQKGGAKLTQLGGGANPPKKS